MSKEIFECKYNWIIDNNKRNTNESLIVYDEECDTLDDLCELLNQQAQRISELEKQLSDVKNSCDYYMKRSNDLVLKLAEKDKLINEYADEHAMLQYKIADLVVKEIKAEDFAIEQLEKVKYNFLDISNGWWLCFKDGTQYMTHRELEGCLREVIDNQIKELKGENK